MGFLDAWRGKRVKLTDSDFWEGFFGFPNASGKVVTPGNAMTLDAVWACIKLLSETVGTLPCMVYNRGDDSVAYDNPLYEIFHDLPNSEHTAVEFWEGVTNYLCRYGNAFARKVVTNGKLRSLVLVDAALVSVTRNVRNELRYTFTENGTSYDLGRESMFHVRGFGGCGDVGLSPISYGAQSLGMALATEETAAKFFSNGMQASGFLGSDKVLNKEQRSELQKMMEAYSGSRNAGKIMILEAGLKYEAASLNPDDAELLASREWHVEQICRWFGMLPIMIGHSSKGQTTWGSGVEQLILQFYKTGIRPLLKRIEAAIWRDLLTAEDRRLFKVEFNMDGFLRGDSAARSAFYSSMTQNGLLTRNEGRALENYPPLPGGDVLTVQSNMLPLSDLGLQSGDAGKQARNALTGWLFGDIGALIDERVGSALKSITKERM